MCQSVYSVAWLRPNELNQTFALKNAAQNCWNSMLILYNWILFLNEKKIEFLQNKLAASWLIALYLISTSSFQLRYFIFAWMLFLFVTHFTDRDQSFISASILIQFKIENLFNLCLTYYSIYVNLQASCIRFTFYSRVNIFLFNQYRASWAYIKKDSLTIVMLSTWAISKKTTAKSYYRQGKNRRFDKNMFIVFRSTLCSTNSFEKYEE